MARRGVHPEILAQVEDLVRKQLSDAGLNFDLPSTHVHSWQKTERGNGLCCTECGMKIMEKRS